MASPKSAKKRDVPEDEPGADQRFSNILKRALNTPPPRKQEKAKKARKPSKRG